MKVTKLHFFRCRIIYAEGLHSDRLHLLIFKRLIHAIPISIYNRVGYFHTADDPAESGILAIQMGSALHHYKELAAGGVGMHGACH